MNMTLRSEAQIFAFVIPCSSVSLPPCGLWASVHMCLCVPRYLPSSLHLEEISSCYLPLCPHNLSNLQSPLPFLALEHGLCSVPGHKGNPQADEGIFWTVRIISETIKACLQPSQVIQSSFKHIPSCSSLREMPNIQVLSRFPFNTSVQVKSSFLFYLNVTFFHLFVVIFF